MTGVLAGSDAADLRARAARIASRRGGDPDRLLADPPSGWLVGTLDAVTEALLELRDAGVNRVMCQHLAHEDLEAVALLGRELGPRVK